VPRDERRLDAGGTEESDDTLFLLFCCCHPDLAPASQVALTLRAVGGLTTREIADAFNVPEATMAQRISRAKRALHGRRLDQPGDLAVVLRVLYLIYTAGHAGRVDLAGEAIRLARQLTLGPRPPPRARRRSAGRRRRTRRPPAEPRTSPSATTSSDRPPARGPPSSRELAATARGFASSRFRSSAATGARPCGTASTGCGSAGERQAGLGLIVLPCPGSQGRRRLILI